MHPSALTQGVRSPAIRVLVALVTLLLVLVQAPAARAGGNDADVRSLIRDIYQGDVSAGRHQSALDSLVVARVVCEGDACSNRVRAELEVAIGTLQALLGKQQQAEKSFVNALKLDPRAQLRPSHRGGKVAEAWEAATGPAAPPEPSDCRGNGGRAPSGWTSAEAHSCYRAGMDAQRDEAWGRCQHAARVSLQLEKRPSTHALLARCLEADGIWTEAIEQWETAARAARSDRQSTLSATAKHHAAALRARQPKLVLQAPKDVADLVIELDGTELPAAAVGGELPLDPGEHQIAAHGTRDGVPLSFEQSLTLEPERAVTVLLTLTPGSSDPATQELLKCLAAGGNADDCLDEGRDTPSDLKFTLGAELSGYHDDMHVDVVTPESHVGVEHATDGWGVNAGFLVDVVTAASVDIVATASPRFQEVRWVPSLGGHKKFGDVDISLAGSLSHEPDYLATSVGGSVAVDLLQKQVVPSLGYEYSHDIAGRTDTPFSVFSHLIDRHAVSAGVGVTLDKATFGSLDYTMVFEDGDSSKPYRHVPMFEAEAAAGVEPGLTIDAVNFFRAPERPLEQLPTFRARFALAATLAHRFSGSTLRGDERIYFDDWGTKATTTDARYIIDLPADFRIWPHLRVHAQTGADFYELAYVVERTATGVRLPVYRTGDRELGPLVGLSGGGGVHWDFGPHERLGVGFNGDVVYTRFLNHLFVKERLGLFGALSFEAVIE